MKVYRTNKINQDVKNKRLISATSHYNTLRQNAKILIFAKIITLSVLELKGLQRVLLQKLQLQSICSILYRPVSIN